MELYINTIKEKNSKIELRLTDKGGEAAKLEIEAKRGQAEKLLPAIEMILKKQGKKLIDIKKIRVENRGGSFTALRIGIVTANALAYALAIPIVGASGRVKKFKSGAAGIVAPIYDRGLNIF